MRSRQEQDLGLIRELTVEDLQDYDLHRTFVCPYIQYRYKSQYDMIPKNMQVRYLGIMPLRTTHMPGAGPRFSNKRSECFRAPKNGKREFGVIRYEARSRGRSYPDTLAF